VNERVGQIAISVVGETGPLQRDMARAQEALADFGRATVRTRADMERLGRGMSDAQKRIADATGVIRNFEKSARDSASAFAAFDRARVKIDAMRASYDPLFAASKRYESAVHDLDEALELGIITGRQHGDMLEKVAQQHLQAAEATATAATELDGLGGMSNDTRAKIQNIGFQVQDFAVQVAGGTDATRALSQQLPQLLSGFGLFGVAAGTAVAIFAPLVAKLWEGSDAAQDLSKYMELSEGSISGVEGAVSQLERVQQAYNEAIDATGGASSAAAALVIANSEREFKARKEVLAVEMELLRMRGADQQTAAANIGEGIRAQADARTNDLDLRALGMGGTDRGGNVLSDYVNLGARNLEEMGLGAEFEAATERDRLALRKLTAELEMTNLTLERSQELMDTTFGTVAGDGSTDESGKGGRGGGKVDAIQTELERLREGLMSQEEAQIASFARQQETLQRALDQKLLTQEQYAALMEEAQKKHVAAMASIDSAYQGGALGLAEGFLGDMANALQGGNERMLRISKAFGTAQALISAWQGAAEALKLPFPENLAAFATVLAQGLGAVQNIRSVSAGGGGAGTSGGAASAARAVSTSSPASAAADPQTVQSQFVQISLVGDSIGRKGLGELVSTLNQAVKSGYRIEGYEFVG
jgi:hypothetical protein